MYSLLKGSLTPNLKALGWMSNHLLLTEVIAFEEVFAQTTF